MGSGARLVARAMVMHDATSYNTLSFVAVGMSKHINEYVIQYHGWLEYPNASMCTSYDTVDVLGSEKPGKRGNFKGN